MEPADLDEPPKPPGELTTSQSQGTTIEGEVKEKQKG